MNHGILMGPIPAFSPRLATALGGGWPRHAIGALTAPTDIDAGRAVIESASAALLGGVSVALLDVPSPDMKAEQALDASLVAALGRGSMALSFTNIVAASPMAALLSLRALARNHSLVIVAGFDRLTRTPASAQRVAICKLDKEPGCTLFVMAPGLDEERRKIARLVRTMALRGVELTADMMPWSAQA